MTQALGKHFGLLPLGEEDAVAVYEEHKLDSNLTIIDRDSAIVVREYVADGREVYGLEVAKDVISKHVEYLRRDATWSEALPSWYNNFIDSAAMMAITGRMGKGLQEVSDRRPGVVYSVSHDVMHQRAFDYLKEAAKLVDSGSDDLPPLYSPGLSPVVKYALENTRSRQQLATIMRGALACGLFQSGTGKLLQYVKDKVLKRGTAHWGDLRRKLYWQTVVYKQLTRLTWGGSIPTMVQLSGEAFRKDAEKYAELWQGLESADKMSPADFKHELNTLMQGGARDRIAKRLQTIFDITNDIQASRTRLKELMAAQLGNNGEVDEAKAKEQAELLFKVFEFSDFAFKDTPDVDLRQLYKWYVDKSPPPYWKRLLGSATLIGMTIVSPESVSYALEPGWLLKDEHNEVYIRYVKYEIDPQTEYMIEKTMDRKLLDAMNTINGRALHQMIQGGRTKAKDVVIKRGGYITLGDINPPQKTNYPHGAWGRLPVWDHGELFESVSAGFMESGIYNPSNDILKDGVMFHNRFVDASNYTPDKKWMRLVRITPEMAGHISMVRLFRCMYDSHVKSGASPHTTYVLYGPVNANDPVTQPFSFGENMNMSVVQEQGSATEHMSIEYWVAQRPSQLFKEEYIEQEWHMDVIGSKNKVESGHHHYSTAYVMLPIAVPPPSTPVVPRRTSLVTPAKFLGGALLTVVIATLAMDAYQPIVYNHPLAMELYHRSPTDVPEFARASFNELYTFGQERVGNATEWVAQAFSASFSMEFATAPVNGLIRVVRALNPGIEEVRQTDYLAIGSPGQNVSDDGAVALSSTLSDQPSQWREVNLNLGDYPAVPFQAMRYLCRQAGICPPDDSAVSIREGDEGEAEGSSPAVFRYFSRSLQRAYPPYSPNGESHWFIEWMRENVRFVVLQTSGAGENVVLLIGNGVEGMRQMRDNMNEGIGNLIKEWSPYAKAQSS